MKCRDAREMINSYFDNKTDPLKDRLLAEHIESCPKCRAELDFLVRYRAIIKTVKPVEPPDNFLFELRRKIELEKAGNPFQKLFRTVYLMLNSIRFPLEAAGVLALAAVVFFLYKPFFNEKIQPGSAEYSIESPRGIAVRKEYKHEARKEPAGSMNLKNIPAENKLTAGKTEVLKDTAPMINADDNIVSKKESESDSILMNNMKKSPSAESEKIVKQDKEKSIRSENMETRGALSENRSSASIQYTEPEKLFREYDASIIKKDLSRKSRLYYRIKVPAAKNAPLKKRLKQDFMVEEKIINKNKSSYEIELFLKDNKK